MTGVLLLSRFSGALIVLSVHCNDDDSTILSYGGVFGLLAEMYTHVMYCFQVPCAEYNNVLQD